MKLLKEISYKAHEHCLNCATYNAQLVSIAKQVPPNTMLDLKKITPRCMWYVEHVLNGDQKDTHNCIWYQNINMPKIPTQ